MNPQPCILQHVFCLDNAAHLAGKETMKLRTERRDQGRCRSRVRLLIATHELLDVRTCRCAGRLARLHAKIPSPVFRCGGPNGHANFGDPCGRNLGSVSSERKGVVTQTILLAFIIFIPWAHAQPAALQWSRATPSGTIPSHSYSGIDGELLRTIRRIRST